MAVNINPSTAHFPASGGNATHQIINSTKKRISFKIKSSNNDHYRVKPVYGFVEAESTSSIEIYRLNGPPRDDKFVILWTEVSSEEKDPQIPFKTNNHFNEISLPTKSE